MTTATTAKAEAIKPEPRCTAAELWRAVAALRIFLHPPLHPARQWLAGRSMDGIFAHGETPVAAVENLLERIGGGANES